MNSPAKVLRHSNSAARKQDSGNATTCRRAWGKIARFLGADDGPTAVEYGVLLMLVMAVCITAVQLLGQNTKTSFSNSAKSINSAFSSSS